MVVVVGVVVLLLVVVVVVVVKGVVVVVVVIVEVVMVNAFKTVVNAFDAPFGKLYPNKRLVPIENEHRD